MRFLLMSIKPRYSDKIFLGTKRYELRRGPVQAVAGDVVIVYASAPVKAVVGAFRVKGVVRADPKRLWKDYGTSFGIEEAPYFEYFAGRDVGNAIEVGEVLALGPIGLERLRERVGGFRPPQSYMQWRRGLADLLGSEAAIVEDGLVASAK